MPRGRGPRLILVEKPGRRPIWHVTWSDRGRMRLRSTGTGDRDAADVFLGHWLLERGPATQVPRHPAEVSVADVLSIYGAQRAPKLVDPRRVGQCIRHLIAWWGDRLVDAIRPQACDRYVEHRVTQGAAIGTAGKELSVLRTSLNHCVKNGHLVSRPHVQLPPEQPGRQRWLTRSEAARLLWESRKGRNARLVLPLFVMVALRTGARLGAIMELRWIQVDLDRGRIDFNVPGRPITNKRRPVIPIPRNLMWQLRAARNRSAPLGRVIPEAWSEQRLRRAFERAVKRARLDDGVVIHALRHTCGTWMAQAGVPLWQVAGWLGHTMARTTELYAHHHPDHFQAAKRAIEGRDQ